MMQPHSAEAVSAALNGSPPENIKLVIWDLDETFWNGTLEEGDISWIPRNAEIVRTLSKRRIVNSIASKNYLIRVKDILTQFGIWDQFVLPQIAFLPKGELVRSVIEIFQLRPSSVLFIDDNTINLNEVSHYSPGIQVATPAILPDLLEDPRCKGAPDPHLSRLQKYRILEEREEDRRVSASDNTEFLRQSAIRISIHHEILDEFGRVHELINRTNQLNFTKRRISSNVAEAQAEIEGTLSCQYNCHAAYIKVADKYGYYGICGFYMLTNHALVHFLFSSRILNMGIEQLVYDKIGRPTLPKPDDVVSDPSALLSTDWIEVVNDAEVRAAQPDDKHLKASICLRGACDLSQAAHYLRERHVVHEEFPFPNGPWGISMPLCDYIKLKPSYEVLRHAEVFDKPWFDAKVMESRLFTRSADVYVLSFGQEPFIFRYRHKATGLIFPINLGPFNTKDLTQLSYATVAAACDVKMTEDQWSRMQSEYECLWRFDDEVFQSNLEALLDHISDKRIIIILSNTKFGSFAAINALNRRVNDVISRVIFTRSIKLIAIDDIVQHDDEMLEMNHFRRDVYMRLAQAIREELDTPASLPPPPGKSSRRILTRGRNLLPNYRTFSGDGWAEQNDAKVYPSDLQGRFPDSAVLRHSLTRATNYSNFRAFGCLLAYAGVPGEHYTLSVWVWIPSGFQGREVSACCAGMPASGIIRASTQLRDSWQFVCATARILVAENTLWPALNILGGAGDEVFSTGWKLETGSTPTDYATLEAGLNNLPPTI